jgi:hypothetical protein
LRRRTTLDWTIVAECLAFILILAVSAYWEPDIRLLHFFQAFIYVAVIGLSLQHNRWGYFIGISIAAFWNAANIFATTFLRAGLSQLGELLTTGHVSRPDLFIAVPAALTHFLLILCCLWAYARFDKKQWSDIPVFLTSAVVSIGYFAAIIALLQPRYLPIFKRLLHF